MDIPPPPPPPPLPYLIGVTPTTTTTTTSPPQVINNGGIAANIPQIPQHHHHHHTSSHSPSGSSIIIVMIVISSAIIVSAIIYLLIRFLSRRCNRSFRTTVVMNNQNQNDTENGNENVPHHVICVANDNNNGAAESLPLFRFSSLTGKIAGGDCAVCLSKFEGEDQLRLLPLCCHAFHAECIDAWLKSNQTCPLCRSAVNPSEADVLKRLSSVAASAGTAAGRFGGNRSGSFRIEIGNVSQRREAASDSSDRSRSYSIGSYEYVLDEGGYEVPVESTHHRRGGSECTSVDKDSTAAVVPEPPGNNVAAEVGGGSGRRNWLRDYVDRFSVSRSSRSQSFRGGSGRFFGGSLRRSETVEDYEAAHGRIGEEISELFRWFSGV